MNGKHRKTSGQNTARGTMKWLCSTTTLDPTLQETSVKMGSPTLPAVFSRRHSLWLSPALMKVAWPGWPTISILWRSQKLDLFKRWWKIFSTWDLSLPKIWEKVVTNDEKYFVWYICNYFCCIKPQIWWKKAEAKLYTLYLCLILIIYTVKNSK